MRYTGHLLSPWHSTLCLTLIRNSVQKNQEGLLSSCGLQQKQLEGCAHLHSYRWEAEFASDLWESTCWGLDVSCWEVEGSSALDWAKMNLWMGHAHRVCVGAQTSYWRKGCLPRGGPSIYRGPHNPHLAWSTLHSEAVLHPQGSPVEDTHSLPPHWGL